jgi:hypothetical protein
MKIVHIENWIHGGNKVEDEVQAICRYLYVTYNWLQAQIYICKGEFVFGLGYKRLKNCTDLSATYNWLQVQISLHICAHDML